MRCLLIYLNKFLIFFANNLAESGCKIIIAGTNKNKLEAIKKENSNYKTIVMDYSKLNEIDTQFRKAISIFGQIDIFISSAGVHIENVDFWTMSPQEFERVINIDLSGTYFACQAEARYMKERLKDIYYLSLLLEVLNLLGLHMAYQNGELMDLQKA